MSSQTKLIKDIFSLYNTILENKEMVEAEDVYDNVEFKNSNLGNPSSDNINIALLQDVQTAAKTAGVNVTITTAISGHRPSPRHDSGNAVDIAIINGKSVSPSNRADADKLVDALVSMGYTKNVESSNDKAVLTFGFEGHDNHVHVSNKGTSASSDTSTKNPDETPTGGSRGWIKKIGTGLLNAAGINEEKIYSSFGEKTQDRYGVVIIPKEFNPIIKSAVSGVVINYSYDSDCENQIAIEFDYDGETHHLVYCGISSPSVGEGDDISQGSVLGKTDSDVSATVYKSNDDREPIIVDKVKKSEDNYEDDEDNVGNGGNKNKKEKWDSENYFRGDSETAKLLKFPYKKIKKFFSKEPEKSKKLTENIDRIKGLLK